MVSKSEAQRDHSDDLSVDKRILNGSYGKRHEGVNRIQPAQDTNQYRDFVSTVMKLLIP
jgi:hypothetical protein